jgi:hypothetical protein
MTEEKIGSIKIGAAFAWDETNHSNESAIAHHVDGIRGIRGVLSAHLRAVQSRGKWSFDVFAGPKRISPPEASYDSKEEALDGLKEWLRSNALTDKPAVPKGDD